MKALFFITVIILGLGGLFVFANINEPEKIDNNTGSDEYQVVASNKNSSNLNKIKKYPMKQSTEIIYLHHSRR